MEKYSDREGRVAIHSMLPPNFPEASRGRMTLNWIGDFWRLIIALRKFRPDFNIIVLDYGHKLKSRLRLGEFRRDIQGNYGS
ncbi:MAG: hypothetical protein NZ901_07675 [Geminocystis sp.]|nr:hypothetical protein [Geminocystis sp.]HIK36837.1 hypothetical protein [Geminocystis sp. M7585_C2015_104]MCS7148051.1 hypothetical protein [Geminocystis sp.]MCX8077795.1 hypothetical protein [Geminocystis sp.]MDW8116403.1 hypothetical protein [Geminocystis sp.]